MSKSILSKTLMSISILLSASLVAQEVTITWDASLQPGQIESFIHGDTTSSLVSKPTLFTFWKKVKYTFKRQRSTCVRDTQ